MKQLQNFGFYILLFSLFTFMACNGDSTEPVGTDVGNGTMTANIDGVSWQAKDAVNGVVYANTMGTHTLQAEADDGSIILMSVLASVSAGSTFEISSGLFNAQYKLSISATDVYIASGGIGSGSITFTTYNDNKVKGTFQFNGARFLPDGTQEDLAVTNGEFEINL